MGDKSVPRRSVVAGALAVVAGGAWWRSGASGAEQQICVRDFGAIGDPCRDDTAALQRAIDHHATLSAAERARTEIVLDGTYIVSQLVGTQANNGLTIRGGTLIRRAGRGPGPNALLTFKQEAGSDVPLERITVSDMTFRGAAIYTDTDIEDAADTAANNRNYQYCNGVEFFSEQKNPRLRGVRNCQALRLVGDSLGKSLVIFDEPEACIVKDIRARRCVGHALAVSAISDHRNWPAARKLSIDVSGIQGTDTMTLIDLSAISNYDNADRNLAQARVSGLVGKRIRGRSKVSGVWAVEIDGVDVDNSGMAFRKWGAINLVARDYTAITVSKVTARNMRAAVLGNVYSQSAPLRLSQIVAIDCNEGVNAYARTVKVTGLRTENTYVPIAVSSANETVVVDGFDFSGVSRQSYVPTSGWPEYGIQSLPTKTFTLRNGTMKGLGNASLAYEDFFIYVPPNAPRTEVRLEQIRITAGAARPFRHFLRNDSPNVTVVLKDFRVATGMFGQQAIANPGRGTLSVATAGTSPRP